MQQSSGSAVELLQRIGIDACCKKISAHHNSNLKKFMSTPSAVSCTEARTSVPQGVNAWSLPTVQAFHIDHLGAYE